jgi:hypothetical protein
VRLLPGTSWRRQQRYAGTNHSCAAVVAPLLH